MKKALAEDTYQVSVSVPGVSSRVNTFLASGSWQREENDVGNIKKAKLK